MRLRRGFLSLGFLRAAFISAKSGKIRQKSFPAKNLLCYKIRQKSFPAKILLCYNAFAAWLSFHEISPAPPLFWQKSCKHFVQMAESCFGGADDVRVAK